MFTRQSIITLASVAAISAFSSASFAGGIESASYNELGFTGHPTISTKARADVMKEGVAFLMDSVKSAGLINSREAGLEPSKTISASASKPAAVGTALEQRYLRDLYIGG